MTALEMLETLAMTGYKACWYAWPEGGTAAVHLRVTNFGKQGLAYLVNYKPATREEAQALLDRNMSVASPSGQ